MRMRGSLFAAALLLTAGAFGCRSEEGNGEQGSSEGATEERGEHDREGGEHGGERGEHDREGGEHGGEGGHAEEGEESGTELSLDERCDNTRNGARLVMAYESKSNSFVGTVENTTSRVLQRVRVEVHLSNGKELGPTTPVDLDPGQKQVVRLSAATRDFEGWTAHPEVGSGEHGK